MKKSYNIFFFAMTILLFLLSFLALRGLTGKDIILRMNDARTKANDVAMDMTMKLITVEKNETVREVKLYRKKFPSGVKSLFVFTSPSNLKGMGFLLEEYREPDRKDSVWLYITASGAMLSIASDIHGQTLFGSDFSYEDSKATMALEGFTYELLRSEMIDGISCYVVKRVPLREHLKKEIGYSTGIGWIRKDNWMVLQAQYNDDARKPLKTFYAKDYERINGVWTARTMIMDNHTYDHRTVLQFRNIRYNTNIPDSIFTKDFLKRWEERNK
jgi:outer membrane lipoprotein-sorting protein